MNRAKPSMPARIVCLTEEAAEVLYLIGEEERIVGVSAFAERPVEIAEKKRVCAFTSANVNKIVELTPDLIIGYSDIQKDIARELIERGQNVWISNHRSLEETLGYIAMVARLVGKEQAGEALVAKFRAKMSEAQERAKKLRVKPRVYLEEWDDPMICGIRYFSEIVELCGGQNIFKERAHGLLARERFVSSEEVVALDPEVIFASWCGKKVDLSSFKKREGWDQVSAVKAGYLVELPSSVILQPGPALFLDGIDLVLEAFERFYQ